MNKSPVLDSMSRSEREEMWNGSYPALKMKPDPHLGGRSSKICPTGLLFGLGPRAHRWAVQILVLNLILTILLLILLIALPAKKPKPSPAGAACLVAACPEGWVGYLGKCYYFSQAEGNWIYSQSNCSALGASLAVIDTQQEMDFLLRYKGPSDHWIGLWREPDQPWMWTRGTEFNNWFPIVGGGLCAFANNADIASSGCSRDAHWICSKAAEKPEGRAKRL